MAAARKTVFLCFLPSGKRKQALEHLSFSCGGDREGGVIYLNDKMNKEATVSFWGRARLLMHPSKVICKIHVRGKQEGLGS